MKQLIYLFGIILLVTVTFSSCKKNTSDPNGDETVKTMDDLVISDNFDWKTTKDIEATIKLPTDIDIMRTKIMKADGSKTYYQGYPTDTSSKVLNTKITIPSYVNSLMVTNGVSSRLVDVNGNTLNVDFNDSFKSATEQRDDDCGACDGQITKLKLKYNGIETSPSIKVTQKKSGGSNNYEIYNQNNVTIPFEFIGVNNHNKMGAKIKVYVNGTFNVEIHTSCSFTILAGQQWGDFIIVSGESDNGGPLCDIDNPGEDDSFVGTLGFEDLYVSKGDYDFNDLVIDYNFDITKSGDYVDNITALFTVRAFGASFHNSFGFQFATVEPGDITDVSGYVLKANTIFNITDKGLESNQEKATIIVYDDSYDLMAHVGGIGVNTDPNQQYVTPATVSINIVFEPNTVTYTELDIGNFNPFIVINQNRLYEVHLADFPPTDLFDVGLFNTGADASIPAENKYFVTSNNLPWSINISELSPWVIEKTPINLGFLKFIEWAESEGTLYDDWYLDKTGYRDENFIYTPTTK